MSTPFPSAPHSPGPWTKTYNEDSQRTEIHSEEHDLIVACIYDPSDEWLDEHTDWDEDKMQEVREAVDANACVMAAAPELLSLARLFRNACDERISILQEERADAHPYVEDFDDQIDHWTAIRNQCDLVLGKAVPDYSPNVDQ